MAQAQSAQARSSVLDRVHANLNKAREAAALRAAKLRERDQEGAPARQVAAPEPEPAVQVGGAEPVENAEQMVAKVSPFAQLAASHAEQESNSAPPAAQAPAGDAAEYERSAEPAAKARSPFEALSRRRPAASAASEQPAEADVPAAAKPDVAQWNEPRLPAGSRYSVAEWEACRRFGAAWQDKLAEMGAEALSQRDPSAWRFHVVEYHTTQEAQLIYSASALLGQRRVVGERAADGSARGVVRYEIPDEVKADIGDMQPSILMTPIDGCLLLNPGALARSRFAILAKPYFDLSITSESADPGITHPRQLHVIRPEQLLHDAIWDGASCSVKLTLEPGDVDVCGGPGEDVEGDPPPPPAPRRSRPRG